MYTIYCDMDGVLVDFERGYKELTGYYTKSHPDARTFWEPVDSEGPSFWATLPWMPDGRTLWNHIKGYKPYILTSPSLDPGSKKAKREWVEKELPEAKNIYFRKAQLKPEFSGKNRILIDDREDTIGWWREQGGIGIHHTSAASTIQQLKNLGI